MKQKTLTRIVIIPTLLLVLFLAYLSFKDWSGYFDFPKRQLEYKKRKIAWSLLEAGINKEILSFNGKPGSTIKDLSNNWQIKINPNGSFPAASLVKIPIMAACFYAVNEGRLKLDENLQLRTKDKVLGSGNLKNLASGRLFSIQQLLEIMITESDNTATNMLIERIGFDYLNDCFKKIGLKNTNISRKMMDFKSRRHGRENFTTASDLAFILEEIYRNKLINRKYSQKCLGLLKKQNIRDRIPSRLPQEICVAHKTGLERGICHDVGIIFTHRTNILICVLTKHNNKTARLAKNFIARVAFLTYRYTQSF
ncbi:MAG: hypothetical protein A2166_05895 [Omnitrophica WOR_2 bacterium RBG_13_41_10]|nr:MAG: hypothetical protein A2166_05895 [Omnitrophica WOR_2 bacterium RBG_13_41_10]